MGSPSHSVVPSCYRATITNETGCNWVEYLRSLQKFFVAVDLPWNAVSLKVTHCKEFYNEIIANNSTTIYTMWMNYLPIV